MRHFRHNGTKTKRFFYRCNELVTLRSGSSTNGVAPVEYLHHSDAFGFLGDIEGFISTYRLTMDKTTGVMVLRPANATDKEAKIFLASPQLSKHSLPLRLISASPVLVERNGQPIVLQKGYHPDVGGLLVENDVKIVPMTLEEAVLILTDGISSPGTKERLGGLFANYLFVTPADYSRAIAQVISPMMKLGQLLPPNTDFPVDLAIADSSQSGKSHRLRFTCLVYGEIAYPLTQKTGGVGSLDESFASALVAGRLFITLDNVRGLLNSMVMESYLRGTGQVSVRIPHRATVVVDAGTSLLQMTSNALLAKPDLINRSVLINIRKNPPDFEPVLPWGPDQLDYIRANQDLYLSAIICVLSEWIKRGKPCTTERRHSFREWTQALDWIVQNLFDKPPLMDDHSGLQDNAVSEDRGFLRQWALFILRKKRHGISFRASDIRFHSQEGGFIIPRSRYDSDDQQLAIQIGNVFAPIFGELEEVKKGVRKLKMEDFVIYRTEFRSVGGTNSSNYYTVYPMSLDKGPPDVTMTRSFEVMQEEANAPRPPIVPVAPAAA